MNAKRVFGCAAVLAALCSTPAFSGDYVTFGAQWWTLNAPEAKFQEYREVPRGGFLESFVLSREAGRDALHVWGENALADDQRTHAGWANGIRWNLEGSWVQIPHRFGDQTRTPYQVAAPGVFLLSDSLQRANQRNPGGYVTTMNDVLNGSNLFPTSVRTDEAHARLTLRPMQDTRVEVKWMDRHRSGYQPYGAPFGFSGAVELPATINQRTQEGEVVASWQKDRWSLQAGGGMSLFENRVDRLVWDNPLKLTDSLNFGSRGQMATAPDNQLVHGRLAFGVKLPKQALFTASWGVASGKQDVDFLPYTINTALAQRSLDSLPARSLNGKTTTISQDYRLSGRVVPSLRGTLRFNALSHKDQSDDLTFQGQSGMDQSWTVSPVTAERHEHSNGTFGLDLDADLDGPFAVGATYEYRMRDRTHREVEKDAENVIGARASWVIGEDGMLTGSYKHGARKPDAFLEDHYVHGGTQLEPFGLRRYDTSERTRDEASATLGWTFGEPLDVNVTYNFQRNDYPDTKYGLQKADENMVIAEATLHPRKNLDVNGGYAFALAKTEQASNMSTPRPGSPALPTEDPETDWFANIDDKNVYVFAGAEMWLKPKTFSIAADYTFSRAYSTYDFSGLGAEAWTIVRIGTLRDTVRTLTAAQDLPDILYRHHDLQLTARYRVGTMDFGFRYNFEEMDVVDFANENVPIVGLTGTSATSLYLGDSTVDYKAHRVGLFVTRRF